MPFQTLAGDAQDALAVLIGAELPSPLACSVGYPDGGVKDKGVWVATDIDAQLPRYISGGAQRDEANRIIVRCLVLMTNLGGAQARDDALELAGYVESAVSADPTLDGTVEWARVTAVRGQEGIPEERKREYGLEVVVSYTATVTTA